MQTLAVSEVGGECAALSRAAGRLAAASLGAFAVGLGGGIAAARAGALLAAIVCCAAGWAAGGVLGAVASARLRAARLAAGRHVTGRAGVAAPIRRRSAFEAWAGQAVRAVR